MTENGIFLAVLFALAAVATMLLVRTRRRLIRSTINAYAKLPIKVDITRLYLQDGDPSFVHVKRADGGEVSRSIWSFVPEYVSFSCGQPKYFFYYVSGSDQQCMVIRKPNTDEAYWVSDGKASPPATYDTRCVFEFHLAVGNVPLSA